jgi:adenosylcobinamide kinase / adenosylcobinamide-phosphate guanylyltransferase
LFVSEVVTEAETDRIKKHDSAMLPKLSLVLGGAASGKSSWAEDLILSQYQNPAYLATAQAWDIEMQAKISRHQQSRGDIWHTIEAPLDVANALEAMQGDQGVLLDCATLWLTNHLLAEHDLADETSRLMQALAACRAPVVVVSNEVGSGIVPDNALSRQFRQAQGELNQTLAAQADLVVTVMAGLPLVLKGQLPPVSSVPR